MPDTDSFGGAEGAVSPLVVPRVREVIEAVVGRGDRPVWRNASVARVDLSLHLQAEALLPPPLRLDPAHRATLFAANFNDTAFGVAYREVGLLFHARLRGRPVMYCPWMVVDDDTALIQGRELFGFPKRMASITLGIEADTVALEVARRGATLLSARWRVGGEATAGALFDRPLVNAVGLPGLPALLLKVQSAERVHAHRVAAAEVRVEKAHGDPLAAILPSDREAPGALLRLDLSVPPSNILGWFLRVRPAGLVSPVWFFTRWPFRTW